MNEFEGKSTDDLYLEMTRQSLREREAKHERRKIAAELKRRREADSVEASSVPLTGKSKGKRVA